MNKETENFIQENSPDGGFLQSLEWKKFQESVGRKTYQLCAEDFYANIIEHTLPLVGKYFYIPRGPVIKTKSKEQGAENKEYIEELISLAKKNNAGWVRIDPAANEILEAVRSNTHYEIIKAPHDMQPRDLLIIDITKPQEQLLAEMKSKTRYNIKIAREKHGVSVSAIANNQGTITGKILEKIQDPNGQNSKEDINQYIDEFNRLTGVMAKRQGISAHSKDYYQKMCQNCPCLKLYVAIYQDKIIAANLVVFYGKTATYLHGASDDQYRNVMAPYLLQWRQIMDAKEAGCTRYDFGGVKTHNVERGAQNDKSWAGITRFKLGFSADAKPTEFPGSYDIIISPRKYWIYRVIQWAKSRIK